MLAPRFYFDEKNDGRSILVMGAGKSVLTEMLTIIFDNEMLLLNIPLSARVVFKIFKMGCFTLGEAWR
jgi:hypothetical protein